MLKPNTTHMFLASDNSKPFVQRNLSLTEKTDTRCHEKIYQIKLQYYAKTVLVLSFVCKLLVLAAEPEVLFFFWPYEF